MAHFVGYDLPLSHQPGTEWRPDRCGLVQAQEI